MKRSCSTGKPKKYAQGTSVPVERSIAELKRTCEKYGATNFGFLQNDEKTAVFFKYLGRLYRMDLHFGCPASRNKTLDEERKLKAEERRKWRVLILTVKAMFESIENDVLDGHLLLQPFTVLPDNTVLGERLSDSIEQAYLTGNMPPLLLGDKE